MTGGKAFNFSDEHVVEQLKNEQNILIGNVEVAKAKFDSFHYSSKSDLAFAVDFDYTVSKFETSDGRRLHTTHQVFEEFVKTINKDLYATMCQLRDKYLPIEYCTEMLMEEKIPHMEKWWNDAHDCIVKGNIKVADIEQYILSSDVLLRDEFYRFATWTESNNIPVVIFSAGIGNVIEIIFKRDLGRIPGNMRIVSNEFQVDHHGFVRAFSTPLIHTFNKNASVIRHNSSFYESLLTRGHLILIGDSLGDVHMDVGAPKTASVLRVGFLNHDTDALKARYVQDYDVVIRDRCSFGSVMKLVQLLFPD